jgi:hypothetical protein
MVGSPTARQEVIDSFWSLRTRQDADEFAVRFGAAGAAQDVDSENAAPQLRMDAYAAVTTTGPDKMVDALSRTLPSKRQLFDGETFVTEQLTAPDSLYRQMGSPASLEIARRGSAFVAAAGRLGKQHAADFLPVEQAPLLRILIDFAQLFRPDAREQVDHQRFFTGEPGFGEDAGVSAAMAALFGLVEFVIEAHPWGIRFTLTSKSGRAPVRQRHVIDRRTAQRDQCRALLRKALGATTPALAALGVTDHLEEIESAYLTSLDADIAIRSCAQRSSKARSCLERARNILVASPTCAPATTNQMFHPSAFELPPLLSVFVGVDVMNEKLHPAIAAQPILDALRGTWIQHATFYTETWVISAAGNLTIMRDNRDGKTAKVEQYIVDASHAGQLILNRGGWSTKVGFDMNEPQQFYESVNAVPVKTLQRFVVRFNDGFLIREDEKCSIVTKLGALVTATCTTSDKQLIVNVDYPCGRERDCSEEKKYSLRSGWVVEITTRSPFVRQQEDGTGSIDANTPRKKSSRFAGFPS